MADGVSAAAEAVGQGAHGGPDVLSVVILLGAACLAVPLFRRLGLGSVLGYLAAGLAVGPFGLGFFHDPQAIIHVAELGVVLFLFLIGLEMQPSRLWAMRGAIFGLGLLQVAGAIAALTCVGLALGFPVAQSFVAGTGFVLTSTAIVMQMLAERNETGQPRGRRIVAILLLEDLAIVPLLALVAFLAPGGGTATLADRAWAALTGLGAIALLIAAGRWLLDPMFRLLARFGAREVMTAAALLVVLGAAVLMQAGGLSMAMGAFLAGVLLSESTFRHQLEADVEPFRGLLLGLFFLGVGMALDLGVIARNWGLIAICVPAYMILKMGVIYAVARLTRAARAEALERAVLMAQGGEFAFVLYATAAQAGLIDARANAVLTAVVIVSMALTPLMVILHDRLARPPAPSMDGIEPARDLDAPIVIIGFGRVGQIVSQPLLARGHRLSLIDTDPEMIRVAAEFGFKVWYGDGARRDILEAAGVPRAQLVVVAIDRKETATRIVALIKSEFPLVPVVARAFDRVHALELIRAGADVQIRETFESALVLGRAALAQLGEDRDSAEAIIADVRSRDASRLGLQIAQDDFRAGREFVRGNLARAVSGQ